MREQAVLFFPMGFVQYDPMLSGVKRVGVNHVITRPLFPWGSYQNNSSAGHAGYAGPSSLHQPFQLSTKAVGNISLESNSLYSNFPAVCVRVGGREGLRSGSLDYQFI